MPRQTISLAPTPPSKTHHPLSSPTVHRLLIVYVSWGHLVTSVLVGFMRGAVIGWLGGGRLELRLMWQTGPSGRLISLALLPATFNVLCPGLWSSPVPPGNKHCCSCAPGWMGKVMGIYNYFAQVESINSVWAL